MFISFRSFQTGEITERFKNVKLVSIEYQPHNGNSYWLHITTNDDKAFSVEYEPTIEWICIS